MRPETIFAPMIVLGIWTGFVLLMTGARRLLAVRAGRVPANAFRLGESAEVPKDVSVTNRNLMNLLEMPVLFYVVCLSLYVTHQVDRNVIVLAWIYVGLRLAHSGIHLTVNVIRLRFLSFALSNFVLLALWIQLATRLF